MELNFFLHAFGVQFNPGIKAKRRAYSLTHTSMPMEVKYKLKLEIEIVPMHNK